MSRKLLLIAVVLLAFTAVSCQKEEEKPAPPPKKVEEPLPAVTQERVDLWLKVSEKVGALVRKFSLEKENIVEKRDLMILVHGNARTQSAYGQIFDEVGMKPREFWNILEVMEKAKRYLEIKKEEKTQNERIEEFVSAGRAEAELIKRSIESEKSVQKREEMEATLKSMERKIAEFLSMKGNVSAAQVGVDQAMIDLWAANGVRMEKALSAMWKVGDPSTLRAPLNHF